MALLLSILFFLLWCLSLLTVVIGIFKPKFVLYWGSQEKKTRGKVFLYYGIASLIFFIVFILSFAKFGSSLPEPTQEELALAELEKQTEKKAEAKERAEEEAEKEAKEKAKEEAEKEAKEKAKEEAEEKAKKEAKEKDKEKAKKEAKEKDKEKAKKETEKKAEEAKAKVKAKEEAEAKEKIKLEEEKKNDVLKKKLEKQKKIETLVASITNNIKVSNFKKALEQSEELLELDKGNQEVIIFIDQAQAGIEKKKKEDLIKKEKTYKENCQVIDYRKVLKSPDKYKGDNVTYSGIITYAREENGYTNLIVSTDEYSQSDNIVVSYKGEIDVYEQDAIIVYGVLDGERKMTSNGVEFSVPLINAKYIDLMVNY